MRSILSSLVLFLSMFSPSVWAFESVDEIPKNNKSQVVLECKNGSNPELRANLYEVNQGAGRAWGFLYRFRLAVEKRKFLGRKKVELYTAGGGVFTSSPLSTDATSMVFSLYEFDPGDPSDPLNPSFFPTGGREEGFLDVKRTEEPKEFGLDASGLGAGYESYTCKLVHPPHNMNY